MGMTPPGRRRRMLAALDTGGTLMFRNRRERGGGGQPPANAYRMQQRMFAIGDDFWIETGAGQRAFKVDGKALRIRKTLVIEDAAGRERYTIREKLVSVREVMTIEDPAGATVATVKKALISPLRERFSIELAGGEEWQAQGNIVDHQYEIDGPRGRIAEVSKRWFAIRDSYGIEVAPGQDDALVLAIAVVIDSMVHPTR
jgi:uncharacterized protein YxjI